MTDKATLSGGFFPTGTITFVLYGPDDASCSGPDFGDGSAGRDTAPNTETTVKVP